LYTQNLYRILCEPKEYEEGDKWFTDAFEVRVRVRMEQDRREREREEDQALYIHINVSQCV
jgi:hypothetical protein